jgi:pimeloyl-ACP methyl ester carboxylesterase
MLIDSRSNTQGGALLTLDQLWGEIRTGMRNGENFVVSGVTIWTMQTGHGFPVMLCNGGPGCCDYLEPLAQMIDDEAIVIRFEQRGCGRSEATPPYDIATCLTDLENIRN